MLTRQGWLVAWGGIALVILAHLLGTDELYVFGAVALGLVAFALLYVRLTRLDVEIDPVVHPARVHAGQVSRVDVRLRNLRRADTPVLRLRDPVSGTTGAELLVPPSWRRRRDGDPRRSTPTTASSLRRTPPTRATRPTAAPASVRHGRRPRAQVHAAVATHPAGGQLGPPIPTTERGAHHLLPTPWRGTCSGALPAHCRCGRLEELTRSDGQVG
jgi:uncharacterized protein (DUF58 family)